MRNPVLCPICGTPSRNRQGAKWHVLYAHTDGMARAGLILDGNLELATEGVGRRAPRAPNDLTMEVLEQWAVTP